ncbi:MAG: cobaltochelatase subunit CobN [Candidatus Bathyarchaeia archaeon]
MNNLKLAYVTTYIHDVAPLRSAVKSLRDRYGEFFTIQVRTGEDLLYEDAVRSFIEFASNSHIVIFHLMGEPPYFEEIVSTVKKAGVPIFAGTIGARYSPNLRSISTVSQKDYDLILDYTNYGGVKNFENLILYLANKFLGTAYDVIPPEKPQWHGIYHPDFEKIPTLQEYMAKKYIAGRPTIGVWFHQTHWQSGDTTFVDEVIREIERHEANVIPVFFTSASDPISSGEGLEWVIETYFMKDGRVLVDAVISLLMFSLSMYMGQATSAENILKERLNVPILKAILTWNTFEDWNNSTQGLSIIDLPPNVVMPEFNGNIITVPVAAKSFSDWDPITGARVVRFSPIPERIRKLVSLAIKWALLKHKPNSEKRVAIIFHNYPPRNDTIGDAFGLDSPSSVLNLLKELKSRGYKVDHIPDDGQKLIEELMQRLTNDRRWINLKEMAERAVAKVSSEQYEKWFMELPVDVREKIEKQWGKPPGGLFVYEGEILIPGIINGNVFIGLQPPRGFLEDPASIYHSPDIPPPHHYYAYYRWIRDVFKADVIFHIGKHGTLEWLPGKSVGLSSSCFPDFMIADLPHVYPYIINNPGEGTQAKRRSYCCIIDHLVPVMTKADLYEELAELEVLLQEYYHAKVSDQAKIPALMEQIWAKVEQAKLCDDLGINKEEAFSNFDYFIEKLHGYLHEISDTLVNDGLHVLGQPPEGDRLDRYLVALTRLSNGGVPSLREAIAELKGYDFNELQENIGKASIKGRANGDIIEEVDDLSLKLIKRFHELGFKKEVIDNITIELLGGTSEKIRRCLEYIADFLVPALRDTKNELLHAISACEAAYIPPGPSGSPTRGMADILPTGRNFYSVDPRAIPSQAAWRVGMSLAQALIERYLKDEGKYPESVGIVVWATDAMKNKGDDIAEILYLMGVKPIWEKTSGRVVGLEVIPLNELKRPRIDVVVRASGLFRDTFPNIIHLIDEAVEMVANLDEPLEMNYIAKHVKSDISELISRGLDPEEAKSQALLRVFSDRPGAYGCGVSELIDSKNWRSQKDLAEVYITWGCYAYSRRKYGFHSPELFKKRLSGIELTVKNIDTREYDLLSGDDWYDAHGGMDVTIKVLTGKAPRSYYGDSSDPDRVKVRSTQEEIKHVFRARLLNPKWINGMKRHGYKGAGDLSRALDFVFGWDATEEAIEDWMYEELAKKYALNPEMQEWMKKVNPYALQNILERLMEAIERGMWQASEEIKAKLRSLYLSLEGLLEDKAGKI